MSRLIDADALKELLQAWKCVAQERGAEINNMFASAIIAQVDAMPTIEPEQQWIPCSEVPNSERDVLVARGENGNISFVIGYYSHVHKTWCEEFCSTARCLPDVLYWCEIPLLPEL